MAAPILFVKKTFLLSLQSQLRISLCYNFHQNMLCVCPQRYPVSQYPKYMITNKLGLSIYTSMTLFSKTPNLKRLRFIILDTLSDILDMCLRFSLIKIESVSISQTTPCLVASLSSVVYTFLLNSFN
jgi:hypothetical protein